MLCIGIEQTLRARCMLIGRNFQPFMVLQAHVRNEDRRDHTQHMIRERHASQVDDSINNEVIRLNSHDGTCIYQLLASAFRFDIALYGTRHGP